MNPSNAEATFDQSTRTQTFCKPSKPCHIGIHWIDLTEYFHEYPFTRVSVISQFFFHCYVLVKFADSSIRVNPIALATFSHALSRVCTQAVVRYSKAGIR